MKVVSRKSSGVHHAIGSGVSDGHRRAIFNGWQIPATSDNSGWTCIGIHYVSFGYCIAFA